MSFNDLERGQGAPIRGPPTGESELQYAIPTKAPMITNMSR
jgi:hypothetical protein